MNPTRLLVGLAFFASGPLLTINNSDAQTVSGPTGGPDSGGALAAEISTDSGGVFTPHKQNRDFERVGLKPGQVTGITVQFPTALAGQTISAAALDGGTLTLVNQGRIGEDGSISMTYKAGNAVGQYRILVGQGDSIQILQFWVRDLNNPQNNPPVYPGS